MRDALLGSREQAVEGLTLEQRKQTRSERKGGKAAIEQGSGGESGRGIGDTDLNERE